MGLVGDSPTSSPLLSRAHNFKMAASDEFRSSTPKSVQSDSATNAHDISTGDERERKLSAVERAKGVDSPQQRLNTSSPLLQAAFNSPEVMSKMAGNTQQESGDNRQESGDILEDYKKSKDSIKASLETKHGNGLVPHEQVYIEDIQTTQTMSLTQSGLANTSFTNSSSSDSVHEVVLSGDLIQVHQYHSNTESAAKSSPRETAANVRETASDTTKPVGETVTSLDYKIRFEKATDDSAKKMDKKSRKSSSSGDKKKNRKLIPISKTEITTTVERSSGSWFSACSNSKIPTTDHGEDLPSVEDGVELGTAAEDIEDDDGTHENEEVMMVDKEVDGVKDETDGIVEKVGGNIEVIKDDAYEDQRAANGASSKDDTQGSKDDQRLISDMGDNQANITDSLPKNTGEPVNDIENKQDTMDRSTMHQNNDKDASPAKHVTLFAEETIIAKETSTGEMSHEITMHVRRDLGAEVDEKELQQRGREEKGGVPANDGWEKPKIVQAAKVWSARPL